MHLGDDDPERPWYDSGVYRIDQGTYRVPLPIPADGLRAVNAYILQGEDGTVVIDPGVGIEASDQLLTAALELLDTSPRALRGSLVTHVHYDHYSQAVDMRRRSGVPVSLGSEEKPSILALRKARLGMEPQVELLRRYGADRLAERFADEPADERIRGLLSESPDRWLTSGEVLNVAGRDLQAIHTPGHTRGHLVFRDQDRGVLFAGDHILPTITPSIGFEAAPVDRPLGDYLRSLLAVRSLPDTRLLPAHGAPAPSTHARIDQLVDHHEDRLTRSLRAVERGANTGLAVAQELTWTRRERRFHDLDAYNQMLAVLEIGFHLDLLAERGRLRTACAGETRTFSAT